MAFKPGQSIVFQRRLTQADFDRYAALSGDDNPIHVDPGFSAHTKFGRTVAHGMLLYSLIGRCLGSQLPGPGTVQAYQELMFPDPTFAGHEVSVHLEVTAIPSPGMVEISTRVDHEDGRSGCTGKTLVWIPGASVDYSRIEVQIPQIESGAREYRGLELGQTVLKKRAFSSADLAAFCDLVGELNPVFTDQAYARSQGWKGVILPGGLLGGLVSNLLGTELPGRGTNWLKQKYWFRKPAYPGQEIRARVEIIRLRPEKDLVNLRTTLTDPAGETVVDGEALVWVSDLAS